MISTRSIAAWLKTHFAQSSLTLVIKGTTVSKPKPMNPAQDLRDYDGNGEAKRQININKYKLKIIF